MAQLMGSLDAVIDIYLKKGEFLDHMKQSDPKNSSSELDVK
jgi:hypothetical protein